MSLYYCAITNTKYILCRHAVANRDFSNLVESYLRKSHPEGHLFYSDNGYGVHALKVSDISFVAITDLTCPRHQPHQFITELAKVFSGKSQLVETAKDGRADALQHSFGPTLRDMSRRFDQYKENIPMASLQANVEGVTNVLRDNLDLILKRGQMAGEIADKTKEMETSAQMFEHTSRKVETKERAKHRRLKFILIGVLVAVLLIILIIILWQAGAFKKK